MTLGEAIRSLRRSAGLSQRELAGKLEVSESYLSLLENDRRDPSIPLLRRIAEEIDVPFGVVLALALKQDDPEWKEYDDLLSKLVKVARLRILAEEES